MPKLLADKKAHLDEVDDPIAPFEVNGGAEVSLQSSSQNTDAQSGEAAPPVTVLVARRIRPGCEDEFKKLLEELCELLEKCEGFQNLKAFEPSDSEDDYKVILSFDSTDSLQKWQNSAPRHDWLARVKPLEIAPPRSHFITGLEGWFTLTQHEGMKAPPRWKMALVTWAAIFPTVCLINLVVLTPLESWPKIAQCVIGTMLTVPAMTWIVMPRVTRLFQKFLYPEIPLATKNAESAPRAKP